MKKRQGSAEWVGGLKDGKGKVSTESATIQEKPYSFKDRFEEGEGTNPEELIATAHASCFSMAFAALLEQEGFKANSIRTTATVLLEQADSGFHIPSIYLHMRAKIPEINKAAFEKLANDAKDGCPVSKLMKAKITMDATLEK
jgi:lipoyl-dependent peroxiredoxin